MRALLALTLVLWMGAACADHVYRWVDETGTVNYGPQRPPGDQHEVIQLRHPPPAPDPGDRALLDETHRSVDVGEWITHVDRAPAHDPSIGRDFPPAELPVRGTEDDHPATAGFTRGVTSGKLPSVSRTGWAECKQSSYGRYCHAV